MAEVRLEDLKLNVQESRFDSDYEDRIAEFKADPEKMQSAKDFVNEVLETAQQEAIKKSHLRQMGANGSFGDGKGIANIRQWHNRARGFMSRMFQAICNCTKTGGPILSIDFLNVSRTPEVENDNPPQSIPLIAKIFCSEIPLDD